MLTRRIFVASFAAAGIFGPALAQIAPAPGAVPVRAVLELFTSQGCSSCPPADKLFMKLAREPGVLALSMPVTIWDYLGWKDTLAQPAFTARQKHYGLSRGDRHIYTPQAIVNGLAHAVGSDFHAIEAARRSSGASGGVLSLPVALVRSTAGWKADIPAHVPGGSIWLVAYDRKKSVEISRGENTGRTIAYANVVRELVRLGELVGEARSIDLPQGLTSNAEVGFAVLLQAGLERRPGAILGAVDAPRE